MNSDQTIVNFFRWSKTIFYRYNSEILNYSNRNHHFYITLNFVSIHGVSINHRTNIIYWQLNQFYMKRLVIKLEYAKINERF